jgi:hypothetical protein
MRRRMHARRASNPGHRVAAGDASCDLNSAGGAVSLRNHGGSIIVGIGWGDMQSVATDTERTGSGPCSQSG